MIRLFLPYIIFLTTSLSGFTQKNISVDLSANYWTSINGYLSSKNPHLNFRSGLNYSFGLNKLSIGYNYTFFKAVLLDDQYSYNFSEISFSWFKALFKTDKHYINLNAGVSFNKKIIGTRVGATLDNSILNSLKIYYPPNAISSPQSPVYNSSLFYLEVGYKYYFYKRLYGSVTGRSSIFTYKFRFDENNNAIDLKKIGLNYSLFFGLGYTFSRDKE